MKKFFTTAMIICALFLVVAVSCKNSPSPTPTPTPVEPTRPATLRLNYFEKNYEKGATAPKGSLIYTDEKGKITTPSLQADGVTTDFNASTAGENKTLKISYQGIDCVASYNVYELEEINISGCFVFTENMTIDFFGAGNDDVMIIEYENWKQFQEYDPDEEKVHMTTYTKALTSAGVTVARVTVGEDRYSFYPDGEGGIKTYHEDWDLPQPEIDEWYVSTDYERGRVSDCARNKYMVARFTTDYTMDVWFVDKDDFATLDYSTLNAGNRAYVVPADKFTFDLGGVKVDKTDVDATKAKNFKLYSRNGFETFSVVSYYVDNEYPGYSYNLKLKDV
ncbi:MAG: hypothetical protein IJM73_04055 [Spirochaetales bacterium]|nr:hypothetical protein [Spirochaetales bacterium]